MFRETLALLYQTKDLNFNTGLIPALIDILYTWPDPTTSVSLVQTFEIEVAKKTLPFSNKSLFLAFWLIELKYNPSPFPTFLK